MDKCKKNEICRICLSTKTVEFLDLGSTPLANALLDNLSYEPEIFPLSVEWCPECLNIQLNYCVSSDILYKNYLYVTPKSNSLLEHYSQLLNFLEQKRYLDKNTNLLEIGSNSGELLNFFQHSVASVVGVDPAENIVQIANARGIPTEPEFFNATSAKSLLKKFGYQDLIIARHCFAHNKNPGDMVEGVCEILSDAGYFVIENAYAVDTIEKYEFDQVYHEHMYYYSLHSLEALLERHGLSLVDAIKSSVHGGSIVAIAQRRVLDTVYRSNDLIALMTDEQKILTQDRLAEFGETSRRIISTLQKLIGDLTSSGKTIYSYGATAKGNTLLNVCHLTNVDVKYCVDSTDIKQGRFLPGSNIQVVSEEFAYGNPPDYFLLTAWNYADEIMKKFKDNCSAPVKFIIPFPEVTVINGL